MQTLFKWLKRLFLGMFYTFILGVCGLLALALFLGSAGELFARTITPPEYPNGVLASTWRSGGTTSMWEFKDYRAPDDLETVLAFYETHIPDFEFYEYTHPSGQTESGYRNGRCHESQLSHYLRETLKGGLPCVSLTISSDPDNLSGTRILFRFDWPAP